MSKQNKKINDSIDFAIAVLEGDNNSIGYNITQRIKETKNKYLVNIEIKKTDNQ